MSGANADTLSWYVVHTHPKQEDRTNSNLRTLGVETFAPRLQVDKYNEFTGKVTHVAKHMFPSYIFGRFRYNELYHKVRYTRGVHSLVSFNNMPALVDDDIVALMQSQIGDDGFVRTVEPLQPGDEVVINYGRFQNFCGVFEGGVSDTDRVRILLNTVSFQAHVVVDRGFVKKLNSDKRIPGQGKLVYSS